MSPHTISEAKREANRANAQASTGPKTEAGKAQSSQNARKHGLSAKSLFLPEEDKEEFLSLYTALFQEVRPSGELQMQYFEQMIHAAWYISVARILLAQAYATADEKRVLNFTRLLGQHERTYARTLQAIQKLQTDLALRAIEENEPIQDLPATCEISKITNEATKIARADAKAAPFTERTHRREILDRIGHAFRPTVNASDAPEPAAEPAKPAA